MQTPIKLSEVKKGDFVRFKIDGPVWMKGHYDRTSKTFALHKFDDVNHETFKKGKTIVFIGFDY